MSSSPESKETTGSSVNDVELPTCSYKRCRGVNDQRKYPRKIQVNQKWTIKRNWQHRVHKMTKNKAKTQHKYVLDTTIHKQTQITYIRHEPFYKQLGVKTNRTSFLCGNRNGHHLCDIVNYRNYSVCHMSLFIIDFHMMVNVIFAKEQ